MTRKERAEKLLEELENSAETQREEHDYKETISEEERFMLRKVGLKMKTFLLMGKLHYLHKVYFILLYMTLLNILFFDGLFFFE